MPTLEMLAKESERKKETLFGNIARDATLLHQHGKENAKALSDLHHPDFYFANSKAAVIARRISENLKKVLPLKTHGFDAASKLIDYYENVATEHERNAQKIKFHGLGSMDYQERIEAGQALRRANWQKAKPKGKKG